MLHVANAPGIAALGNVTRQVLVDLGFKVEMKAMDFQTFATQRLNTKSTAEGGWNLAHTTNTVPDQGNPISNPFLVAAGHPASAWGWPTDPEVEALRIRFAKAETPAERKEIAAQIQIRAYEQVLYLPLTLALRCWSVGDIEHMQHLHGRLGAGRVRVGAGLLAWAHGRALAREARA